MAKYFLHVKVFSRGKGSRVTRAAAYRAGERIRDERTSEVYNYSDRHDVLHKEIVLASQFAGRTDADWARDRAALWNAAEHAGRRNARLAREVLVTLPPELEPARRMELARTFARELADRYQSAVDLAVHEPRRDSDERHHHAHLLMTAREVTPEGLGRRTALELSGTERYARGLPSSKAELLWIRERWAQVTNQMLLDAGLTERIDHRSYQAQGIDREPVPMMPQSVYYAERASGRAHPVGEAIRARHRERIEARLAGKGALERVLQRQTEEGRRRAREDSARKEALPKKISRATLTREELNRIRRERYRATAAEQNRKQREQRKANAPEINRKKREWRKAHAAEVNRQQREAYHRRRAARGAVREGGRIAQTRPARQAAAEEPAKRAQGVRELRQESPTREESARRWLKFREQGERSPTAEESARRWVEWRERQNSATAPANSRDANAGARTGPRGDDEDVEAATRDPRRDNTHGL